MLIQELNESSPSTKDALLTAAKKIFAAKGYAGATVKEVADEAGVNVSLVSYHYNGKENLFRACIEAYGIRRLEATEQFLKEPRSVEDFRVRLTLFLEDYFSNAISDQDTMTIMHRECLGANPITHDLFEGVFMKSVENMMAFFAQAKKNGILRESIDPHYVVLTVMGAIAHAIQMDCMHEQFFKTGLKDPTHREKLVETLLQLVMGGTQS